MANTTKLAKISKRRTRTVVPLVRSNLATAAFEQLVGFVVKGDWKEQTRIPAERDLCARFGIARTSLREALKAMELVGLLESRIGQGTYVCPRSEFLSKPMMWAFSSTDHNDLMEILESRTLIEQDLAEMAALRASEKDIESIALALEWMRKNISEGQSILEPDMAFHAALGASAHNDVLANAAQLLRNMLRQWIYLRFKLWPITSEVEERNAVLDAIKNRDPRTARQAMKVHFEHSGQLVAQANKTPANRQGAA